MGVVDLSSRGRRGSRLAWRAVRFAVAGSAFATAFVDGLGFFLSPGQAVVQALSSAAPDRPDARWGIFLGLVFYAGLAFVSVIMRAQQDEPELAVVPVRSDLDRAA